jgi:Interferon-induced transmembrane protein
MKCPNCAAEIADTRVECEFCGHHISDAANMPELHNTPSLSSASIPELPSLPVSPPVPSTESSENPYANYSAASSSRQSHAAGSVPNHLVWAIASTICCCWPMGIVAIVYAAQVDSKLAAGDYEGAVASSNNAKLWSWISFGGAALIGVLYIMLAGLGFALEQ